MKIIKPLPHAILDYVWAGTMMAAPWIFGFKKDRAATINSVASGAAILGLSLMTRYPLGVVKLIPFPVHGTIETVAGIATASAPWLLGFSNDERAKWTHLISGINTLAVVALTDYQAAESGRRQFRQDRRGGAGRSALQGDVGQLEHVGSGPQTDKSKTARTTGRT
jgi:hypothetical protein